MRGVIAGVLVCGSLALLPGRAGAADQVEKESARPAGSAVCAACHGADGNSVIPVNPSLAGQHPEYLYKQLRDFKSGARGNPLMAGVVAGLSDADMRNLAAYYAMQQPRAGAARDVTLVTAGQKLYRGGNATSGVAACAGCHSPDGAGIPAQYPRLKGQHPDYMLVQLKAFRAGERANDNSAMMRSIAARMTEREMQAVAEYIAGLQ